MTTHNRSYPTDEEIDLAITELRNACRFRKSTLVSIDVVRAMPSEWWQKRVKVLLAEFDGLVGLAENHRG